MEAKKILIPAGIGAAIIAVWYYLRGSGTPLQVSYPNANASGLPAWQSPGVANFFGASQAAPSPNLIYGAPPKLPPTPAYQRFNYSPLSIFNLTPEAASKVSPDAVKAAAAGGAGGAGSNAGSGCGGGCGCDDCNPGPQYMDGNMGSARTSVAANPSEQILAAPDPTIYAKLQFNLDTSVAADPGIIWPAISNAVSAIPAQF